MAKKANTNTNVVSFFTAPYPPIGSYCSLGRLLKYDFASKMFWCLPGYSYSGCGRRAMASAADGPRGSSK
jgi:hypothetical protein